MEEIARLEAFGRGLYAGPVGWIGKDSADFAVAIRSAVVAGDVICLFAGAGIVESSDAAMEWEETEFYKNELTQIETGRKLWGCENRIDWDERCRYLDLLIQSIRAQGYKLAHQVSVSGRKVGHFLLKEMSEEVTVNIGRNGQYLFQDGRHRLSIAKILGVKRIPVKILVRHKKWQELREKLIFMAKGSGGANSALSQKF